MRIITGSAKGIRLVTLEGEATRPTAERVKEAIFSILQFDIEGRRVLDVFAGSGQLSLEALSRGACEAVMVDSSREAQKIINANVEKTKMRSKCRVVCMDALEYIRRSRGERFDIVFLDPPYASGLYEKVLSGLLESDMLKVGALIVCESDGGDETDIFGGNESLRAAFDIVKSARYSRAAVNILTPKKGDGANG